ncbi:hypothetical protein MKW92_028108 [Papaver armeniacum]|nr:hypothetical protein MKW92_028108 [Papaver armeniacum]
MRDNNFVPFKLVVMIGVIFYCYLMYFSLNENNFGVNKLVSLINKFVDCSINTDMAMDYCTYDYEFGDPSRVTSLENTDPLQTSPRVLFITFGVVIKNGDGSVYKAEYVMVSACIGVLQTNLIDFMHDLPAWKLLDIYQFDMSIYTKIFLKLPYKFWPTGNGTGFLIHAHEKASLRYHVVGKNEYLGANCLLVTIRDDESRWIEQQKESETLAKIMDILKKHGETYKRALNGYFHGAYLALSLFQKRREYLSWLDVNVITRIFIIFFIISIYYSANILIKCAKKNKLYYNIKEKGGPKLKFKSYVYRNVIINIDDL